MAHAKRLRWLTYHPLANLDSAEQNTVIAAEIRKAARSEPASTDQDHQPNRMGSYKESIGGDLLQRRGKS
jgi:hypothetical protein